MTADASPAAAAPEVGGVTFCVPLRSRRSARDWTVVVGLLHRTLRSLANQRDPALRVLLACHDVPPLPAGLEVDVEVLEVNWEAPADLEGMLRDKVLKKRLCWQRLRELGGGYAMQLDADDVLSSRFVEHVRRTADPNGYVVREGYAFDHRNRWLAPVPGTWSSAFDRLCGSSAVIRFGLEDLSARGDKDRTRLVHHLGRHHELAGRMAERGRPLAPFPFPAAVYVVNHGDSLQTSATWSRDLRMRRQIRRHSVPLTDELLAEFAL